MFDRARNGWRLAAQIRRMIMSDKRLFVFPILIGLITLIEFIAIFASVLLIPVGGNVNAVISNLNASSSSTTNSLSVASSSSSSGLVTEGFLVLGLALFYLISTFTSMYLVIALLIAFRSYVNNKDKMSFSSALKATRPYLKQIFEWALFYATVLLILRLIESRLRGIGRLLVAGIGSLTLALASFFAAQIILDKKTGPIATIKASIDTIFHHFGATFGGVAYSDLYGLMFAVLGILVLVIGIAVFAVTASLFTLIVPVIGFILLVFGILISFTTLSVFKLILYDYITTGVLPPGFDKNMINMTIKQKKRPAI